MSFLIFLLSLCLTGYAEAQRWNFTSSVEGWTGRNIQNLTQGYDGVIGDYVIWATASGANDPGIVSPTGWSIWGQVFNRDKRKKA